MNDSLRVLIEQTQCAAKKRQLDDAFALAEEAIAQYPTKKEVWDLRAFIRSLTGQYDLAIADISTAINLDPRDPYLFFDRARYHLGARQWQAADNDSVRGLELCEPHERETFHFLRAEALLQLGHKAEALVELAEVDDDLRGWTFRFVRKEDLMAECQESS